MARSIVLFHNLAPSVFPSFPSSSSSSSSFSFISSRCSLNRPSDIKYKNPSFHHSISKHALKFPLLLSSSFTNHICRAAEYKFPDPIPEFADSETEKFRTHLSKKLSKKDLYGDTVEEVVGICTEIFSTFLHTEYGGPGTLLVLPFIDMADAVNELGLPGGSQAAHAAIKWAQDHVDKDWKEWTGDD